MAEYRKINIDRKKLFQELRDAENKRIAKQKYAAQRRRDKEQRLLEKHQQSARREIEFEGTSDSDESNKRE